MRHFFTAILASILFLMPGVTQASLIILTNCFDSAADYSASYEHELSSSENKASYSYQASSHTPGSGAEIVANCSCPANVTSSSTVSEYDFAGSPLAAGVSGYGVLTDKLDIQVTGFNDAIDSPDGNGLSAISVKEYPTPIGSMLTQKADQKQTEGSADVCSDETRPTGGATVKRKFKLNMLRFSLYVKQPIIGE